MGFAKAKQMLTQKTHQRTCVECLVLNETVSKLSPVPVSNTFHLGFKIQGHGISLFQHGAYIIPELTGLSLSEV